MSLKAIPLTAGAMTPDSDLPTELVGLVQGTTGTIVIHDSVDVSGPVVLASGAIGTVVLPEPVKVSHGVFVVLGTGATGSLLV